MLYKLTSVFHVGVGKIRYTHFTCFAYVISVNFHVLARSLGYENYGFFNTDSLSPLSCLHTISRKIGERKLVLKSGKFRRQKISQSRGFTCKKDLGFLNGYKILGSIIVYVEYIYFHSRRRS